MNNNLLKFIRHLSKSDKKSLSQKTLKTTEEIGELAKVVLPFENAYATTHRFVDKKKILEEIADSLLCLYSIGYELDFSDDEIEEMINLKAKKWSELQSRETKAKYPVPYEFHITVRTNDLDKFKKCCILLGIKPIVLDLQNQDGESIMHDIMTSSTFVGENREAFDELEKISKEIESQGFEIIRKKIETVPWHPAAPSIEHMNPTMPSNCYFESHIGVICNDAPILGAVTNRHLLQMIAKENNSHLSKNIFKKIDDTNYKIMITKRSYSTVLEQFKKEVHQLEKQLLSNDFIVDKAIIEFSIYDTKIDHDKEWTKL